MNQLYVTTKNGVRHWYVGDTLCHFCNLTLEPPAIGFVIRLWKKEGNHEDLIICPGCTDKIPSESIFAPIQERFTVVFSMTQPPGSRLVFPQRPNLSDAHISPYDAASHKVRPSEKVIDLTRLAGRPDSTFLGRGDEPVLLGVHSEDEIIAADNALIESVDEGLAFLEAVAAMPPALTEMEKKQIEDKRGDSL